MRACSFVACAFVEAAVLVHSSETHRLLNLLELDCELCCAIIVTAFKLLHLGDESFCVACELRLGACCCSHTLAMPRQEELTTTFD